MPFKTSSSSSRSPDLIISLTRPHHLVEKTSQGSLLSAMAFQIPERTSSKRNRREIETERDEVEKKVKKMRQTLKPQASFNSAYVTFTLYRLFN
jgi:hypothetical protein